MIKPFPFPAIRSSLFPTKLVPWVFPGIEVRTITRALMSSFLLEGSTRRSKASLFQVTLKTLSTSRRTVCLQLILSSSLFWKGLRTPLLFFEGVSVYIRWKKEKICFAQSPIVWNASRPFIKQYPVLCTELKCVCMRVKVTICLVIYHAPRLIVLSIGSVVRGILILIS